MWHGLHKQLHQLTESDAYDGKVLVSVNVRFSSSIEVPSWLWRNYHNWRASDEERDYCHRAVEDFVLSRLREALSQRLASPDDPDESEEIYLSGENFSFGCHEIQERA